LLRLLAAQSHGWFWEEQRAWLSIFDQMIATRKRGPTTYEKHVCAFANHLAFMVQRRGADLVLREKYKSKRVLGTFQSFTAIERWLYRYLDRGLRKFDEEDVAGYERIRKREGRQAGAAQK
jgi:hypothetical protein